jgi:hypothetical protein
MSERAAEHLVYQNENYKLIVGVPPATPQDPEPTVGYLIVNKETGVLESWHSILFYAKQNADMFNKLLLTPEKEIKQIEEGQTKFSFN